MQVSADKNGVVAFNGDGFEFFVGFHRTIRLPEDGKTHALPPSLGLFPVKLVDDYKDKVPKEWLEHGGVFIPLHEREALWLGFHGSIGAVKVAAGKINAVSGKPWDSKLKASPTDGDEQDYMVAPSPQPWLDGFNTGKGVIKQFVGMAMGKGYTVEGQVTGEEKFGGIQILVAPPKESERERVAPKRRMLLGDGPQACSGMGMSVNCCYTGQAAGQSLASSATKGMRTCKARKMTKSAQIGMAAGGTMKQKIYPDPFGVDTWDQEKSGRLFVHIVNAEQYEEITGEKPPAMPESAQSYAGSWYGLDDKEAGDVPSSKILETIKTVAGKDKEHGFEGQQDDSPVDESGKVHTYPHKVPKGRTKVRNGTW
jgi:hypothetical protein